MCWIGKGRKNCKLQKKNVYPLKVTIPYLYNVRPACSHSDYIQHTGRTRRGYGSCPYACAVAMATNAGCGWRTWLFYVWQRVGSSPVQWQGTWWACLIWYVSFPPGENQSKLQENFTSHSNTHIFTIIMKQNSTMTLLNTNWSHFLILLWWKILPKYTFYSNTCSNSPYIKWK